MSEIKHTPGPWFAVKNAHYWEIRTAEFERGGEQIGDACASGFIDGQVDNPIEDANARLLAAAPELLEALLEIKEHGLSWDERYDSVIARATGVQP